MKKSINKICLLIIFGILISSCNNQEKKIENNLFIDVGNYVAEFTIESENIIRFQYYRQGSKPMQDPHLIKSPTKNIDWSYKENSKEVNIYTKQLNVKYNLENNRLSYFERSSGKLILKESINGKSIKRIQRYGEDTLQIQQSFLSPNGEILSGLGFQNYGTANFRGRYIYLCQDNAASAVPLLHSSNNYGLLWNNASFTEFNPEMEIIPQTFNKQDSTISEGIFKPSESGKYCFVMKKDEGERFNQIHLSINDSVVFNQGGSWDAMAYTVSVNLEKGKKCKVSTKGNFQLYFQLPSAAGKYTFKSELADGIDYHFIYGENADKIINGYRKLTGKAPLFPKWAYGFFQSKERYKTDTELIGIVKEYRKRNYPLDVIVQDWQYWGKHGWNAMRFDTSRFKDISVTLDSIHNMNVKVMISVWPNFGDEKNGSEERITQFGEKGFLTKRTEKTAKGELKGKNSKWYNSYYDVMNPKAQSLYWSILDSTMFRYGMDAWWLDATEPKVRGLQGGWRYCSTSEGPAAYWLNAYPLMQSKGVYEGQRATTNKKRVFILSRTAYSGIQRFATAVWTGDTQTRWGVYKYQIANGITCSNSGIPYHTSDIGGFLGLNLSNSDHIELYTRRFQFGAFCPIFRAHGTSASREVWQFGKESEEIQVSYLNLRYRLLPYIYSLAADVTFNGGTIMRGLMMDFPYDSVAVNNNLQFMFGKSILVAPVTNRLSEGGNITKIYLPQGSEWFDFWTGEKTNGGQFLKKETPLETIPLFVKAGSIIPMGPYKQYATEKQENPIELRVYTGADASFVLYEDENDNYNYENNAFAEITIHWNEKLQTLTFNKRNGKFEGMLQNRIFNIVWVDSEHGIGIIPEKVIDIIVKYNGDKVEIKKL